MEFYTMNEVPIGFNLGSFETMGSFQNGVPILKYGHFQPILAYFSFIV